MSKRYSFYLDYDIVSKEVRNLKTDMTYTKDTLTVKLYGIMDQEGMNNLKRKLYRISSDYEIDDIVLNISESTNSQSLLDELLDDYYSNFHGHVTIKEV